MTWPSTCCSVGSSRREASTSARAEPRLRSLRQQRGVTLAQLSGATGISVSTLSRLEAGQRRPTLELLLLLTQAYQVPAGRTRRRTDDR